MDVTRDLKGGLKTHKEKHHAAIVEPDQVACLMRAIYAYEGNALVRAALKLSALTFVRPGELRQARWHEFDFVKGEWRIPAAKMKMKIDHIVPLSKQALTILHELEVMSVGSIYVFPSMLKNYKCMSENTVNAALRYMGFDKQTMTAHGFRATARTMLDEVLGERVDIIEHQLAHQVIDVNGRAYNRTSHLHARRSMMQK